MLLNVFIKLLIVRLQQVVYIVAETEAMYVGENDANLMFCCSERLKCIGTIFITMRRTLQGSLYSKFDLEAIISKILN